MENTLEQYLEKVLEAYSRHYDIERDVSVDGGFFPAKATYYMRDENYLISKKHVLSALENHGHIYFYLADNLDADELQKQIDLSLKTGLALVKPHKEHMSTFVSLVVLANTISPEAKALIKKTSFRKSYRLALHGWMEFQIIATEIQTNSFLSNPAGKGAKKSLEKYLSPRK